MIVPLRSWSLLLAAAVTCLVQGQTVARQQAVPLAQNAARQQAVPLAQNAASQQAVPLAKNAASQQAVPLAQNAASQQAVPLTRSALTDLRPAQLGTFQSTDSTTPPKITAAPRPLLLYIPFHVSEPASHIADMIDCTFRLQPWRDRPTYEFDVLLAISGRSSAGNEHQLKRLLEDATAGIVPKPRMFVEFKPLKSDRYVQDIVKEQKDADWVGGPNTAFYDAFLDGHIHRKYVRHYTLVQQLETDVCALKPGWLDDLVAPAVANPHLIVSGATIKGDCVYIRAHDRCESNDDEHMKRHINGNALYRVGADLKAVLTQAKASFSNSEPFDLALYWAAAALGMEHKLHSNPIYFNIASLVDTARMLDAAYYGGVATMVHVPRRLRSCMLRAVASRGFVGLPLTVIVVDDKPAPSLLRLVESLTRHQIERYILLATSEAAFVELSKTHPLRVLPAYVNGVDKRVVDAKADGLALKSGGDAAITTSTAKTLLKAIDATKKPPQAEDQLACQPWMRDGASSTSLLYTLVARLVRMGYAPFVIDQHTSVLRDHELALFQMSADGVYVTGKQFKQLSDGAVNVAGWRPALSYFPRSGLVASTADSLAKLVDSDEAFPSHLPFKPFPPHEVADGGVYDVLSQPLIMRRKQLVRSPGAAPADFDQLVSRAPPHTHVRCANYTLAVARSVDVERGNIADTIKQVVASVAMARAQSVSCVVLPNLVFKRRSAATIFQLVDATFFANLAGGVRLVPSIANIDTERAPFIDVTAHHQRARTETSVCGTNNNVCLSSSVRAVLAAADAGLGRDFVCVRTMGIDHGDNAFVLRGHVDAVARAVTAQTKSAKIFLRGTWRHLPVDVWSNALAPINTLAHVRATLQAPPSPFTAQPFGEGDSVAFDAAWADAVESIICAGAKASMTVRIDGTTPTDPAVLTGTPHTASDLADFRAWLTRPDRPSLRGPVIVLPATATCTSFARAARLGLMLAHAAKARHVVLPVVDPAWRINTTVLHASFPNLLPPTVARLLYPPLTFDALLDGSFIGGRADPSLGHKYTPELTLIHRTRRSTRSRTALWTANATDSLHKAMRAGLREADWLVLRNAAADDAAIEQALRAAVTQGSDDRAMDGFTYLRRVDAVFGTVCAGVVDG